MKYFFKGPRWLTGRRGGALGLLAALLMPVAVLFCPPAAASARPRLASFIPVIARSLVIVQYTAENEFHKTTKIDGQGIVLTSGGVVLVSANLIPGDIPLSYVKHLVIRLPYGALKKIPATYLGRTVNGLFCYIKADSAKGGLPLPPLKISPHARVRLGQSVFAIGLLPKDEAYRPYVGINHVKAIVPLVHPLALTDMFGLTRATSPVYGSRTGAFLGLTVPDPGQSINMALLGHNVPVLVKDPNQEGVFLTWRTVARVLTNVPVKPFHAARPWLGTADDTGLKPALRKLYKIKQRAGIVIGSVIPAMPAAKAGLKSQDIILTINGKPFSRSAVPTLMLAHFERALQKMRPGRIVKFGILRHGRKYMTIPVKIGTLPPPPSRMARYYDHKLGLVVRKIAFADTYARKLSASLRGVIVSLVKGGAPASLGRTPLKPGYVITRVNNRKVTGGREFMTLLKRARRHLHGRRIVFVVIKADGNTAVCRIGLH